MNDDRKPDLQARLATNNAIEWLSAHTSPHVFQDYPLLDSFSADLEQPTLKPEPAVEETEETFPDDDDVVPPWEN